MVGFGAGYVLGAKAGIQRYEQLRRLYQNLAKTDAYKKARSGVKDAVGTGIGQAKDVAVGGVKTAKEKVTGSDSGKSDLRVAPPVV
jgi:hypothetical protein